MRIERVFTTVGSSPYDGIGFRTATSEIRNPDGSVVFRLDEIEVPSAWSQVAVDVLAQKYFRKAGIATRLAAVDEPDVPAWLQRRRADQAALEALPETERYGGETSARQVFDRLAGTWTWWGWKGGYFDSEADAQAFFDELRFMLASQQAAPNSPQWFNTGLQLGLWHRRPGARPLFRRRPDRRGQALGLGLRAAAAARLLHPEHLGRPGQPGRDHGSLGARGAPVQIWLRHRHQLLEPARRERAALGRRQVVRPDELPQDRRPRGRGDQVRRHHAARRQDGGGRRRPSGHLRLRPLEGDRGAEGRGPGRGLEAARAPSERDPWRLPRGRPGWRGALQPQGQPRAQEGDPERPRGLPARERAPAGDPVRPPGLHPDRAADLLDRLGFRTPTSRSPARTPTTRSGSRASSWSACSRTASGSCSAAPTGRSPRPCRRASSGGRSRTPPGAAPIPASSTTPRSTSGTPAPTPAGSTPRTRARSTCSSTTRRAISPRST